ncbi:mannose-1-phosphate guanylyltransferase/mannose-6-phosphate isomerase [Helicobacter mesocricetorum]|uniref:mannose-1-phosphate guanylyltransferase/mannose-6-phosphate isomerase n=1 Tax=Helicobacter mesocricetorum TaxID=87012 RepID=UPI000CF0A771|nr:mannose-1-phosphate guanylyltransferase/mannose-6-phosphate isomerase [Helicobacter mesocricetorum]
MTNIILCGGGGTRLFPLSRTLMPKQFIPFFNGESLFELTLKRNFAFCEKALVVCNAEQYFLALDKIEQIKYSKPHTDISYLLEPMAKNTAPAITLACLGLPLEEIVLVTPSDHLIKDMDSYKEVLQKAKELANNDSLVTFGITPKSAHTGFGYIQMGEDFNAESFMEKPKLEVAQNLLREGNYFWNSGLFCFRVEVLLKEMQKHSPDIFEQCERAYNQAITDKNLRRIPIEAMQEIPQNSIDYALMEKSKCVKVLPCDIGWSDVGSFDSLYEELPKDKDENVILGNSLALDSKNNLIISHKEKLIALIGIEDCMVIDTGDVLLVGKRSQSQRVKTLVENLGDSEICKTHLTTHRPWGSYTILEDSMGYKIKKIIVKPGKSLSLQKHFHRNEHWIVVSGSASVQVGNEKKLVRPNESTYIKMGEVHRLSNEGKIPVVLIEAQVGEYTGEDDIVRLEDDFGRS